MMKRIAGLFLACCLTIGTVVSPEGTVSIYADETEQTVEESEDSEVTETEEESSEMEKISEMEDVTEALEDMTEIVEEDTEAPEEGTEGVTEVPEEVVETEEADAMSVNETETEEAELVTEVSASDKESILPTDNIMYHGQDGAITWCIDNEGTLYLEGEGDYEGVYDQNCKINRPVWTEHCYEIKKAVVHVNGITNTRGMFFQCKLTEIDLHNLNTENVTDMSWMFYGCENLTSLDVSKLNTENVTDMSWMFGGCSGLTSLDVSSMNTTNVTNMEDMFYRCSSLTNLDISGFDTANVTSMGSMFDQCSSLTSLDISGLDTSNVACMGSMFYGCRNLTSLDVSNFDTSNVEIYGAMFSWCSSLTSLDVSNFNTTNATDMSWMFSNCSGLKSLDLSGMKTENVTKIMGMFNGCSGLKSLDLSNFNTAYVNETVALFSGCTNLVNVFLPDDLKCLGDDAFAECYKLEQLFIPNSVIRFGNSWIEDNTVIKCYPNSAAHQWAVENNHAYMLLDAQHEHTYKVVERKEATCTKNGYVRYVCTYEGCNDSYTESIPAKGHDYKQTVTPAQIGKDGKIVKECGNCGAKETTATIAAIDKVTLSATSYTYNEKERKPSVTVTDTKGKKLTKDTDYTVKYSDGGKNPGKYTVTVTFKGNYTGTKKLTYTIKPKTVSISKVTAEKNGFQVTWKKGAEITGYQLQYATDSKFSEKATASQTISKSSTTSQTISKLDSQEKYYVRIRTYKTIKVDGKEQKIYSDWSDTQTVITENSKGKVSAVKTVKLSKTSYTYTGKACKPTVTVKDKAGNTLENGTDYTVSYAKGCKNPGKYTVTVKFKGNYSGTAKKTLTFTIKPKAVSVSKLSAGSKNFTVSWKKGTEITGYEIQYSTSSKFTEKTTETATVKDNKTTSKKITKLSAKKKYYVRIRTYKTVKVDGKSTKIYSSWSDAKTVTTKK